MKRNTLLKSILVAAVLSTVVVGCRRQLDDMNSPEYENAHGQKAGWPGGTKPPAYHIAKSDKLDIPTAIQVPDNLPAGNTRVATYFAEGVQKYKAQQKAGSPGIYEWVFVAPEADLYDKTNKKIGTHTAGPSWQLFGSADSIFAQQFAPPRTAPSTEPATIDWLLLMPKVGKTPTGIFANVSYIQRIATQGGKAPVTPPSSLGETVDVRYTAVYRFTSKN